MEDELKVKVKINMNDKGLKDVDDALKLLAGDSKKAKGGLDDLEKGLTGVDKSSAKTKKSVDDLGKGLTGVSSKGKDLGNVKQGLIGVGAGAKGAVGGVSSLTGAFSSLMATMLPVLSVAAIVGFGKKSLEAFGEFEKGMNTIFTLLPAKSAEAEKAMGGKVQETMKKFGLTAEDATTAVYNALSAGVPEDNVFKFIEDSAKSAKAGGATLDDAASVITTVMNNFRSSNLDSLHVSDLLFATVKKGVTTFPELATSIGDVLPSMNSARVSFEETSATMATLTATMGKGSTAKAGTSLRAMIDELNNSSTKTSKTFKQLAGKDFKSFMESGGNISQVIDLMKGKADKMGVSVADMFQSVESKKAVNILNDNKKVFDENLKSFKNVAGATDEAYGKMNRGWTATSGRLSSSFSVTMIKFGNAIAPIAELVGVGLLGALELITPAIELFGTGVGMASDFLKGILSPLAGAMEITGAFTPIIQGISTYFGTLGDVILDVGGVIMGYYKSAIDMMGISTEDVATIIKDLGTIGGAVFSGLATAISTTWGIIKPILEPLLEILGKLVGMLAKISFSIIREEISAVAGFLGGGAKENQKPSQKKNALGTSAFTGGATTISEQGKELFATPSGLLGLSPNSRAEMSLPQGTEIFSNKKTKNILETAKNLYSNNMPAPSSTGGGSSVTVNMPIQIANVTQQQVDKIKSLTPAIRALIENILADKESDANYRLGVM